VVVVHKHSAPTVVGDRTDTLGRGGAGGSDKNVLRLRALVVVEVDHTRNQAVENCHSDQWRVEEVAAEDSHRTNADAVADGVEEGMVFLPDDDGVNAVDHRRVATAAATESLLGDAAAGKEKKAAGDYRTRVVVVGAVAAAIVVVLAAAAGRSAGHAVIFLFSLTQSRAPDRPTVPAAIQRRSLRLWLEVPRFPFSIKVRASKANAKCGPYKYQIQTVK
jgi:hypothetical protein